MLTKLPTPAHCYAVKIEADAPRSYKPNVQFTEAEDAYIVKRLRGGATRNVVARELGRSHRGRTAHVHIRLTRQHPDLIIKTRSRSTEHDELILQKYREGTSIRDIAEQLNRSTTFVRESMPAPAVRQRPRLLEDEIEKIHELHAKGISRKDVARDIGRSVATVDFTINDTSSIEESE